ncbi:MAG: hypothetical protein UFE77_00130, partial [Streptococcus salivarius]|nr:hypothetical protein [Streptococcus salivarius]
LFEASWNAFCRVTYSLDHTFQTQENEYQTLFSYEGLLNRVGHDTQGNESVCIVVLLSKYKKK